MVSPQAGVEKALGLSYDCWKQTRANSASVFVRQVWLNIDPACIPPLSCYAWNLGISDNEVASLQEAPGCATEILSEVQMVELAAVFCTGGTSV